MKTEQSFEEGVAEADMLRRHPGLYRAMLACRVGRNAWENKATVPHGYTAGDWALYQLLFAVEEMTMALMPKKEDA